MQSRILDAFVSGNEKPEIITAFLKNNDAGFESVINDSVYGARPFQLDYILSRNADPDYILNKLDKVDRSFGINLVRQIYKSDSSIADRLKYDYKTEFGKILNKSGRHPYAGGHDKFIGYFDNLCFEKSKSGTINEIPYEINKRALHEGFRYLDYSLFNERILQYDFFSELETESKYVFLKSISRHSDPDVIKRFAAQLLDSDEIWEIKFMCLSEIAGKVQCQLLEPDVMSVLFESGSMSEVFLKLAVFNIEPDRYLAMHLLMFNMKWIKEWADCDFESLKSCINTDGLSEYI